MGVAWSMVDADPPSTALAVAHASPRRWWFESTTEAITRRRVPPKFSKVSDDLRGDNSRAVQGHERHTSASGLTLCEEEQAQTGRHGHKSYIGCHRARCV